MERERSRADNEALNVERERSRVALLSPVLAASVVQPTRFRRAVFRMISPQLQDDDLVVTLHLADSREPLSPRAGEVLILLDPEDGKWQGTAEVLDHRSLSGKALARIVDADPVFRSFLEEKAIARETYLLRAVAVYPRIAGGAVDG